MRTLKALEADEQDYVPRAAAVTSTDFYIDDILTGGNTLEEAKELQSELVQMLRRGGMELHKWVSNHPELLHDISTQEYSFESRESVVKTLGMLWKPKDDHLTFKTAVNNQDSFTKRQVLSEIAKLLDPLGLIGPVATRAKIFMQRLWLLKLDWNEELPPKELCEWKKFLSQLQLIDQLNIPRYVLTEYSVRTEIHGFSDASEKAYGAAIYIRCITTDGMNYSNLHCSKSRVSPLKPVTIPRLELCRALLLCRLVSKVIKALQLSIDDVYLWCDSIIVLAWINTPVYKLKTFVSNRIAEIQTLSHQFKWGHVASKENPADIISRGARH
ncbi:uncharacterized protein LOC118190424 [Stegodyphus dumicola]|uniref:uncharacterized protein LOC118190424 n=1 Tax=Stegodyphus dumicola TaxID=202533 RepID=UPI0015A81A25|nr:uncharacterized protein LOC118190424 [Stegodyphus dumicola]